MALTVVGEADQVATVGTEHTLDTETTSGVFQLRVDTKNMVNGDVVEIRMKTKVRTGGTSGQEEFATYANVQSDPIKKSIPVESDVELICTLKQTAGTSRTFPWKLIRI